MSWWKVSADTVAASRFVISPLAETTASLMALQRGPRSYPGVREWLGPHLPAYGERLAGDPVVALALDAALGTGWVADFLTPPPIGGSASFARELATVRETPPERALADLRVSLGGELPTRLHRSDVAVRLAGLLEWVWNEIVRPDWPRRRQILQTDILTRSTRLGHAGWMAALDGMRPGIRWLGDGRLQVNAHNYPPRDISAAHLLFVPVTPGRGWVSWDEPSRYALTYPCAGVLAEPQEMPVSSPLSALIGPGRAQILALLDSPRTTTQLVALTGLALGSVGRHLKTLLESRLVERRRVGRSVLYSRTAAGDTLVGASTSLRSTADIRTESLTIGRRCR